MEANEKYLGQVDVTPFVYFFLQGVLSKLTAIITIGSIEKYQAALREAGITEKEKALWQFVLTFYGSKEFSTKALEKDFGNAACVTIYHFVHKFQELGSLNEQVYRKRTKYRVV